MEEKEILLNNTKNFLNSANIIYKIKDYTSATILYFKAMFSALDLILLKELGKIPKDHTERFRILEKYNYELYILLDSDYPLYRNAYNAIISKEDCDKVRQDVDRIIKEQRIL
jgi:uncharacterized protein (UPF0332 family)